MSIYPSKQSLIGHLPPEDAVLRKVHILVMGLTGVGKSTFIKAATGDPNIVIGRNLDAGTVVVADYVKIHGDYEIHLIDTPGFNDAVQSNAEILDGIAQMLNTVYRLNEPLAGVLYLHDITADRVGASGENTLRLLERLLGDRNYGSCTLVTTKWDKFKNSAAQRQCEHYQHLLETDTRYWNNLRTTGRGARVARFHNSHKSAMEIIKPILEDSFVPVITQEMVSINGDALNSLKDTRAGAYVMDFGERSLQANGQFARIEEMHNVLNRSWQEDAFQDFLRQRRRLKQLRIAIRGARLVLRLGIIGGGLVGTVVTKNPALLLKSVPMSMAANRALKSTANRQLNAREQVLMEKYGAILDQPIGNLPDPDQFSQRFR